MKVIPSGFPFNLGIIWHKKKSAQNVEPTSMFSVSRRMNHELTFVHTFVRNSQFFSSFATTSRQNTSTIFSRHSASETVLVSSFAYRRLKRSFHDIVFLNLYCLKIGWQRYVYFTKYKASTEKCLNNPTVSFAKP